MANMKYFADLPNGSGRGVRRHLTRTHTMTTKRREPMPTVEWEGSIYCMRSHKMPIPDLKSMERFAALGWLISNTYPQGYRRLNPLAGVGGVISVGVR
jgi:hypothetical protein